MNWNFTTFSTCRSGSWGWTLGRVHAPPPLQTLLCLSSTDLGISYQTLLSPNILVFVNKHYCRQNYRLKMPPGKFGKCFSSSFFKDSTSHHPPIAHITSSSVKFSRHLEKFSWNYDPKTFEFLGMFLVSTFWEGSQPPCPECPPTPPPILSVLCGPGEQWCLIPQFENPPWETVCVGTILGLCFFA